MAGAVSGAGQAGYEEKVLAPGNGHDPKPARAPGACGQRSQTPPGWDCWGFCDRPGAGLGDPCGSLPVVIAPVSGGLRYTVSVSMAEEGHPCILGEELSLSLGCSQAGGSHLAV